MSVKTDRVTHLETGDHLCLIYETAAERSTLLAPYFISALARGSRCLLIGTRAELAALERSLETAGVRVGGAEDRGALVLLEPPAPETGRSGRGPGARLDLLRQAEQQALDDGFANLLVAGELATGPAGEAMLGRFLAGSRTAGLCLYDRAQLTPEAAAEILRTHPLVVLDGEICLNAFAEPPELVLGGGGPSQAAARTQWMLASLRHAAARERESEELARRLVDRQSALDRTERSRDDFLAMLAHELRNPLGTLSNAIQVLRLRGHGDEIFERAIGIAERQLRHQAGLVDGLLEASLVRRGMIELRLERLDLVALVREVASEHRGAFAKARLKLALEVPNQQLVVRGDRLRLAQALANLLRNALKFTPAGGRVTVRARAVNGSAEVSLRDSGTGIPADLLPHVFEVFAQSDRSLDRSKGGLGVGLTVAKGLAELHGGDIAAASAGAGLGAEFTLRLPLEPDPAARALARDRSAGPPPEPLPPRRVLVVEDNPDAAASLCDFLELSGHEVELASSGTEGVEAARQFHPEVVLCDLGLPGIDGFAVATELRRDPATASAELIAVTGYGREEDRRRSRAAGFDLHLTKPVDPARLRQVLQHSRAH